MNWKLIFLLSLIAIPMAFATVYYIPSNVEPVLWIVIFIACAFIIAKFAGGKYFLHGFMVSIFNCVWITSIHFLLFDTYYDNHPQLQAMKDVTPQTMRYAGLVIGPVIGIISGLILGLFSWVAAKIVRRA
ncbi:MAG: hypothetical protein ABIP75_02930 [Pyrinomonadaceae bacterium]